MEKDREKRGMGRKGLRICLDFEGGTGVMRWRLRGKKERKGIKGERVSRETHQAV